MSEIRDPAIIALLAEARVQFVAGIPAKIADLQALLARGARLVDDGGFGHAVHDTGRRKQEALHPRPLRELGEMNCPLAVNITRPIGIQVADRIVAERRQVDHRIAILEVLGTRGSTERNGTDRMSATMQPLHYVPADESGRPGDRDVHGTQRTG